MNKSALCSHLVQPGCKQADYATDAHWKLCSAEALTHFLAKQDISLNGTTPLAKICHQTMLTPAQSARINPMSGNQSIKNELVFVMPFSFLMASKI
jgi:hypothetical protein